MCKILTVLWLSSILVGCVSRPSVEHVPVKVSTISLVDGYAPGVQHTGKKLFETVNPDVISDMMEMFPGLELSPLDSDLPVERGEYLVLVKYSDNKEQRISVLRKAWVCGSKTSWIKGDFDKFLILQMKKQQSKRNANKDGDQGLVP